MYGKHIREKRNDAFRREFEDRARGATLGLHHAPVLILKMWEARPKAFLQIALGL
jgi:hypothetical protein